MNTVMAKQTTAGRLQTDSDASSTSNSKTEMYNASEMNSQKVEPSNFNNL